jgi:hypothetical protein
MWSGCRSGFIREPGSGPFAAGRCLHIHVRIDISTSMYKKLLPQFTLRLAAIRGAVSGIWSHAFMRNRD